MMYDDEDEAAVLQDVEDAGHYQSCGDEIEEAGSDDGVQIEDDEGRVSEGEEYINANNLGAGVKEDG